MNLLHKRIYILIYCFLAQSAFAQSFQLNGNLLDSSTRKPLYGASISLLNARRQAVKQTQTDSLGHYQFTVNKSGIYQLLVAFAGFQNKIFEQKTNENATLLLQPTTQLLQSVTISTKENLVQQKVDRQVFKSSLLDNAQSGTAIDLLKNLPSVTVDAQGEVNLRGSSHFLLLVNGKPVQGDAATVLGLLSANAIAQVEVITNPSAKYDADGRSGAINIITKKGGLNGWNLNTTLMGGLPSFNTFGNHRTPKRYGADVLLGYKQNKWDINLGLNALRNDASGYREGDAYTLIQNIKTAFPSVGERSFNRYNYAARLSANYAANATNHFSAGFYIGRKHQDREADLTYTNQRTDLTQTKTYPSIAFYNANNQAKEAIFTQANTDFTHQFKNKSTLSIAFLYEGANLYGTTTNSNEYQQQITQLTLNKYTNPLSVYRLKADFEKQLGKVHLETGYQYRFDHQNGQFDYYTKTPPQTDYELIEAFTSNVQVNSAIHALYVQASSQTKKWYYNGGLRYEWANRQLRFGNAQQPDFNLQNLFPSVQIKYASSATLKWKLGYNRRIRRTANFELNPFPEREHAETLERGDAYLQPELISLAEFGFEKKLSGSAYVNVTAYHQHTRNIIQRLNSVYNDTILNRIFSNASLAKQWGLESNLNINITSWWQMMAGVNVFTNSISGSVLQGSVQVNNARFTYSANTTHTFKLPQNYSVQFSGSYLSLRPTAQGEDGAFFSPNLSLKKVSTDKKYTFLLQWLNVDAGLGISNRQRITTRGTQFYTTTNYIVEPDVVQFSLQYNINPQNKKVKLPSIELAEKEF